MYSCNRCEATGSTLATYMFYWGKNCYSLCEECWWIATNLKEQVDSYVEECEGAR